MCLIMYYLTYLIKIMQISECVQIMVISIHHAQSQTDPSALY